VKLFTAVYVTKDDLHTYPMLMQSRRASASLFHLKKVARLVTPGWSFRTPAYSHPPLTTRRAFSVN